MTESVVKRACLLGSSVDKAFYGVAVIGRLVERYTILGEAFKFEEDIWIGHFLQAIRI